MNAVEIEEAVSQLASEPFNRAEFPYSFLSAFGNKPTTIARLRSGASNASDVPGGILQRNHIHIATCDEGETGAFMTVCKITRNDAENRIRSIMTGKGAHSVNKPVPGLVGPNAEADSDQALPDIAQQSNDLIRKRIAQRFKGHALTDLIAGVLESQGYITKVSPPGPDGGVDILAGRGPLGFDAPRLIVQVKSQDAKVDAPVVRELNGVMHRYQADNALLVGWGGFTKVALSEASSAHFKMRLWDSGDVVAADQDNYEQLPATIRAEIPLRRVWTLLPDDEDA